jgi:hypothetical protein
MMINRFTLFIAAAAVVLTFASVAFAGQQHVDQAGLVISEQTGEAWSSSTRQAEVEQVANKPTPKRATLENAIMREMI